MKSNYKLLVGVVAGTLAGAAGSHAIHGQEVKAPPVYLISEADVITDPTGVKEYGAKVLETLAPFNDHYHFVVRGGKIEGLDGGAPPKGMVIFAFDTAERRTPGMTRQPTPQSDRFGKLLPRVARFSSAESPHNHRVMARFHMPDKSVNGHL